VARDLLVRSTVFVTDELAGAKVTERITIKAQDPKGTKATAAAAGSTRTP
jgi:hypothetical protein